MKTKHIITTILSLLLAANLVACSSGDSTTSSENTTSDSIKKDTFVYAVAGEPRLLDPAIIDDTVSSQIITQIYYPLFTTDDDGNLINAACVDYNISDDGLTYTLYLDPNNKWSDGESVTADQYVYAWKRAIGFGVGESMYSQWLANFVVNAKAHSDNQDDVAQMDDIGIKAIDDTTIELTLHTPCPYLINTMTMAAYLPLRQEIAKEHDSTWANDINVPTNGAYHLIELDATTQFKMQKNEYFAHADEVKTEYLLGRVMSDMDAQLMAFQTGEIYYANSLNTDVAKMYEGKDELVVYKTPASYYLWLNANTSDNTALKDVRVRRAIQLGINRQSFVTALDLESLYYELNGFVPKGIPGINGDFREEEDSKELLVYTDKEEAKTLLKEAGYDENNPLELEYYYNSTTMHDMIAEIIKAELAEVNINVTLKVAEIRTFFDDRENGLFEMCRGGFSADFYDPETFIDLCASNANGPVAAMGDAEIDAELSAAQRLGGTERIEALHAIEEHYVRDKAYIVPLMGYGSFALQSTEWKGIDRGRFWYVENIVE